MVDTNPEIFPWKGLEICYLINLLRKDGELVHQQTKRYSENIARKQPAKELVGVQTQMDCK